MSIPAGIVSGGFEENASEAVSADPDLSAGSGVFVQNDGQYDPEILFVTSTDAGNIALCRDGIRQLVVVREQVEPERWYEKPRSVVKDHSLVSFEFVGGSPESVVGDDRVPTVYNFFLGKDPSHWATGVSGFQRITYRDVWDGIDIVYYQRNGHLKYDLILSPGADPDSIRMSVEGADSVRVVGGSLSISTHVGVEISDSGLCARYSDGGAVKVAFELDGTEYGFDLGGYDASRTVVIDPEYNANAMNFSTFIGGSGWEYPNKIDLDSKGDIYITGSTDSYDFPTSKGAYQKSLNGWENAFVFKLNRAGNSMLYATYIGGSYSDQGYDIEVDGSGNAYVVGVTYSEDFPVTMGAYNDTLNNASDDLFFLELDWIGGSLSYSTYFGGSDSEMMPSLEIDTSGTMYVASATMSRDFPITSDAYQDSFVSPLGMWLSDATLVKFDLASMKLVYSTFMGGTDDDITTSILYDGYVYICGGTRSTDFNISSRPYIPKINL